MISAPPKVYFGVLSPEPYQHRYFLPRKFVSCTGAGVSDSETKSLLQLTSNTSTMANEGSGFHKGSDPECQDVLGVLSTTALFLSSCLLRGAGSNDIP